ncbi:hypothetical protein [Thermococcus sp.]
MKWKWLSVKRRKEYILSIFGKGEELTATEIVQRLEKKGIEVPSPQAVSSFIRNHLEHSKLRRVRRKGKYGTPTTFWRLINGNVDKN